MKASEAVKLLKSFISGDWNNIDCNEAEGILSVIERQAKVVEAARELAILMQDVIDGEYVPDSFTLQPIHVALAEMEGLNDSTKTI